METDQKLERFNKLAEQRMNKALKAISLISNLSNRATYHYTQEHVTQMFTALKDAVAEAEASFQPKQEPAKKFTFSGIDASQVDFHDDEEAEDDDETDEETEDEEHE